LDGEILEKVNGFYIMLYSILFLIFFFFFILNLNIYSH